MPCLTKGRASTLEPDAVPSKFMCVICGFWECEYFVFLGMLKLSQFIFTFILTTLASEQLMFKVLLMAKLKYPVS